MTSALSLTSEMRNELYDVACKMIRTEKKKGKIKFRDKMEGSVTTSFVMSCLGTLSGFIFEAEIETDGGKGKVKYLVDPVDMEPPDPREWVVGGGPGNVFDHVKEEVLH